MIQLKLITPTKTFVLDPLDGLTIPSNMQLNDNLQHQEAQISVRVAYDVEVLNSLIENSELQAQLSDNNTPVFSGIIDTGVSWTDSGNPEPLDNIPLVINDNTYKLQQTTEDEFACINISLAEITRRICLNCGLSFEGNSKAESVIIPAFVLKAEQEYYQAFSDLLFEYKFSFGFTPEGNLCLIDLDAELDNIELSDLFSGVKVQKTKKKFTGVKLSYGKLTAKENEQIYFEGGNLNEDSKVVPYIITPGSYYPVEASPVLEEENGQVYQDFAQGFAETKTLYNGEKRLQRSQNTELIYTTNHYLVEDWTENLSVDRTDFKYTQASVRFFNASDTDAELRQLAIRATAYYRSDAEYILGTGKRYLYDTSYIYDTQHATNFADFLSKYFLGGNLKITFKTDKELTPGQKIKINTNTFNANVKVLAVTHNYTFNIFEITAITEQIVSLAVKKNQTQSSMSANQQLQRTEISAELIESIIEEYYLSDSRTELINGTWQTTPVVPTNTQYVWTRTTFIYSDGSKTTTEPISVSGEQGADGKNAIVMTSATAPNGEYNGQIGIWQGQVYRWNGTSWVLTSGILPTDAVLHYSFDDLPDGDASYTTPVIDNSGNNYNATDVKGLVTKGVSGKCFNFNGVNSSFITQAPSLGGEISFSFWIKLQNKGHLGTICQSRLVVGLGFSIFYFDNLIRFDYGGAQVRFGKFLPEMEKLYHIVITQSATDKTLFVDGVKIQQIASSLEDDKYSQYMWFGLSGNNANKPTLSGNALQGSLDDFQIFNRALFDQEVLGLYLARGNTPKQFTLNDYRLNLIDDDGVISVSEKKELLSRWKEIYNAENVSTALPTSNISATGEFKAIIEAAITQEILNIDKIQTYIGATNAIRDAVWGANGYLTNLETPSTLTGSLDSLFATYRQTAQDANNAISQQQASKASAITVITSNEYTQLPVDESGNVTSYEYSGNVVQVLNGTTVLTPTSASTLADNQYKVTASGNGITAGSITVGTDKVTVGNSAGMTKNVAEITYTITVKVNGVQFTLYAVQKISKASRGADARIYMLTTANSTVVKSPTGNLTPSSVTVEAKSYLGSNVPAPFACDFYFYENNVQKQTYQSVTSASYSPTGNYPVVVKIRKPNTNTTATVLDQLSIPILNEIKGDGGKNAITMTSATTPNGEYNGQIGVWQGQVYSWNGTSWVLTSGILPTDSVLHYSFDELPSIPDGTSGDASYTTPIIDNSGNNYNTTTTRGIVVDGINNKGLFLNKQVSGRSFKMPSDFTVSLWCKAENDTKGLLQNIISTNNDVLIIRNGATWGDFLMYYVYTQKEDGSYDTTGRRFLSDGGLLPANVWINLAITKKDNIIKCYYNGELKNIDTRETGVLAEHSYLSIGNGNNTRGQTIDDFQIFNRALSDQEVLGLYLARGNTPKRYTFADYQLDNSSGKYYGYEKPAVPFLNDTYLDTTTGYLYEYDGVKWVAIIDVSDSRYNKAVNDMVAYAENNPSLPFITARNAWIKRLAVDGLLANEITTKMLSVKDKGVIKSENYNGTIDANGKITKYGTKGWAIDHTGSSDFVNLNATNANISGSFSCNELSITGVRAGNVVLRNLKLSDVRDGQTLIATTQIIATGTVRIHIEGYFIGGQYTLGCNVDVLVGDKRITMFEKDGNYTGQKEFFQVETDVQINEGDYVGVAVSSDGSGIVAGPSFSDLKAWIGTSSNQGVLAYLGDYGTTTKTGGWER